MTELLADSDERARALDPEQSFIVQAPAGSGKTELLTQRVLLLLAYVNNPEEILALTFTRKAAAEMRDRVVTALRQASAGVEPQNSNDAKRFELARAVLKRDAELQWSLLENPQRLRMSTIDSLCTELAQRLPVLSTLGGAANPVDSANELYLQAARRFLEKNYDAIDRVLLQTGNRMEVAMRMFASMLSYRDQWLRNIGLQTDPQALRQVLETMLADIIQQQLVDAENLLEDVLGKTAGQELWELMRYAGQTELDLEEVDSAYPVSEYAHTLASIQSPPPGTVEFLGQWAALANTLLLKDERDIAFRKKVTRVNGFPSSKKDAESLGKTESELKARSGRAKELLVQMNESDALRAALGRVKILPNPTYRDEEWALLQQLIEALPKLLLELYAVFSETQSIDFVEMSARAQRALGDEQAPTDLALALDMRLQHILVDEFQDTSLSQFELFNQLLCGWSPGDGKSIFIVGDPMQSIYRFRNADVGLFRLVQNRGIQDIQPQQLTLSVNFRSSPDIVAWVNTQFQELFDDEATSLTDPTAIAYSESIPFLQNAGDVQSHLVAAKDRAAEAQLIASLAAEAVAETAGSSADKNSSVAILVRTRTQAKPIFKALRKMGLAYQSIEMDTLGDQPVVRDLIALCMSLRYPHDRLHWLSLLRAPWCALSLQDLHILMKDSAHTTVFDLIQDEQRVSHLNVRAQKKLRWFVGVLAPAVNRAPRSTLVPWLESVWLQLGGPAVCHTTKDLDAANRCLNKMQELEVDGKLWQLSVLQASMQQLYAESSEPAAIQVMTMHKAKGLEFDTVILPALDAMTRGNDSRMIEWSEFSINGESQLLLAPFLERNTLRTEGALNKFVKKMATMGADKEMRRLLYVACTRAKSTLHLTATLKTTKDDGLEKPKKQSLLALLWPVLQESFEKNIYEGVEILGDTDTGETNETPAPELIQIADDWVMPELSVFRQAGPEEDAAASQLSEDSMADIEFIWAGNKARHIGTVVHGQLQQLGDASLPDADSVSEFVNSREELIKTQLLNLGMPQAEVDSAVKTSAHALRICLNDETGRWILGKQKESRSEWALSCVLEDKIQRIIIDRTFIDDNDIRWIIDFKTGDHKGGDVDTFLDREQERYSEQLNNYARIVSTLDTRPIQLGLYFPLLGKFRQFKPAQLATAKSDVQHAIPKNINLDLFGDN